MRVSVIADGMLMRVSTIDPDSAKAYAVQAGFVRDMHDAVKPEWRSHLFGAGPSAASAAALTDGLPLAAAPRLFGVRGS